MRRFRLVWIDRKQFATLALQIRTRTLSRPPARPQELSISRLRVVDLRMSVLSRPSVVSSSHIIKLSGALAFSYSKYGDAMFA
jgi:hypothetical protein